MKNTSLK